jgi:hypothetical protein
MAEIFVHAGAAAGPPQMTHILFVWFLQCARGPSRWRVFETHLLKWTFGTFVVDFRESWNLTMVFEICWNLEKVSAVTSTAHN